MNGQSTIGQLQRALRELAVWLIPPFAPALAITVLGMIVIGGLNFIYVAPGHFVGLFVVSYAVIANHRLTKLAEVKK